MDLLIYTNDKVLRMSSKEVPYLKRSTKGNRAMTATSIIKGMTFLVPNQDEVLLVITKNGMINKLSMEIIPKQSRGKAGQRVIKLSKDDQTLCIKACSNKNTLIANDIRSIKKIPVDTIPMGTTIISGTKLLTNPTQIAIE